MKTSLRPAAKPSPQRHSRPRVNDRPYPKTRPSGQHLRRQFLRLAAGAAALPAVSRIARAQAYPSRPITMIVPVAPGGPTDVIGRLLAERMRKPLGQPVIVENVTGADGTIGTGRAARARPDGYTIDVGGAGNHVFNGALYSLQYDLLNDFAPISTLALTPQVLFAKKALPPNDLNELIAWLKANPNKASAGIGAPAIHILTALFLRETGTQFTLVPYRGAAPATQDLLASQIDLLFNPPDQLPLMRAGRIKAYAVTSETRSALAPEVPTFAELGLPRFLGPLGMGFSRPRERQRMSLAGSTRRPWRHWPIQQFDHGSPNWGTNHSRASDRPRRRSAHL